MSEIRVSGRESSVNQPLSDYGIAAVWDKSDSDYIQHEFAKIREISRERRNAASNPDRSSRVLIESNELANKWTNNLVRRWNDQTAYDAENNRYVEPIDVEKEDDLIVTSGLAKIAMLVTGESTAYFNHFASGTSTIPEARGDISLRAENARVSLFDSGYQTSSGTSMKFSGFFPTGVPSAVITEGGVFDNFAGGNMLFRTVYSNSLVHTQYETVYTLTQVVLMTSISKIT